ncbi:MAG TPA: hypothetical protein DEB16_00410 [Ruminococcaceae bacterium]|jgi:hypothetical protein|nr:hypothetical protein [Oscillospiraceae bacterium]HBG55635.1 hypothetical protein [Oscillospiraceae bacterium]HBT90292.1 hypothetical protein [Oscillospiraceae bacterium]HCB91129.1 hypothetical protein [Oscillospiraceae bacterium]
MISPTYGSCSDDQVVRIIVNYIRTNYKTSEGFNLIVGTDSQNYSDTKMVVVIAVQNIGHGGIFFYDVLRIKRIDNIRQKLLYETSMSLKCADKLISKLEDFSKKQTDFDFEDVNFCIHVDAGTKGKTSKLIPDLVSWIRACGYNCKIKPDSFAASSIADKISK